MDYNSLKNQIISYTNRNEPVFVSNIPDLINQAMSNIYSRAKTIGFQKTVSAQMAPDQSTIPKPVDYKSTVSLQYTVNSEVKFLLNRSYEFCTTYWPNITSADENSPPLFYSADLDVQQNNAAPAFIYIAPTPKIAYPYRLIYLSFPPVFNEQNSQNFLTDKYPNLLLYGCMVQAIPFLKSDERAQLFTSLYEKELENVNKDTAERYIDRVAKRTKD